MQQALSKKLHVSALSLGLGICMAFASLFLSNNVFATLSPFALTALILVFGMFVSTCLGFTNLVEYYPDVRSMYPVAIVGSVLLFLSTFGMVWTLKLSNNIIAVSVAVALSPFLTALWRRVFWKERRSDLESVAIALAHCAAFPWIFTQSESAGFVCAYFAAHLWSINMALLRPQYTLGAFGAVWSWISIGAGLIGLPILWSMEVLLKSSESFSVLGSEPVSLNFEVILPVVFFGGIMNALRGFVGVRVRKIFDGYPLSLLWVVGMIGTAITLTALFVSPSLDLRNWFSLFFLGLGLACFAIAEGRRTRTMLKASQSRLELDQLNGEKPHHANQIPQSRIVINMFDSSNSLWTK